MIDFSFTEDQLLVRNLAREFAKAVRIPNPDKAVPAFTPDPIAVEDAIEMIKIGLPVPVHPADDHADFYDAYSAAAMDAMQAGEDEEASLLRDAAMERLQFMKMLMGSQTVGQDVGNPDGSKSSDKGRPVAPEPGGGTIPGPGSSPPGGGSPGPSQAPPGRDLRGAM